MALRASFKNMYRTKDGRQMFVYFVSGTPAELQQFKEAQGEFFREDEATQKPLLFTNRMLSYDPKAKVDLIITSTNKVIADETSRVFARAAMVDDYAAKAEGQIIAERNLGIVSATTKTTAAAPVAQTNSDLEDLTPDADAEFAEAEVVEEAEIDS